MQRVLSWCMVSLVLVGLSGSAARSDDPVKGEWIEMFNGKTMEGWKLARIPIAGRSKMDAWFAKDREVISST